MQYQQFHDEPEPNQFQANLGQQVNGNIQQNIGQEQQIAGFQINTLDEPVTETILRDLRMIMYKLKYVLKPKLREEGSRELRNWDLWGPLLLCLMLALTLGIHNNSGTDQKFGVIFMIIWLGAFIITLNAQILGGKVYILQSVCVLGYCIFPINLAAICIALFKNLLPFALKFIIIICAFLWSSFSSIAFMSNFIEESKKVISVYPIFLFYLFLSWFCLFQ